jgi:hypothetical protein
MRNTLICSGHKIKGSYVLIRVVHIVSTVLYTTKCYERNILWRIDPLLGKDLETTRQHSLLGSCNSWTTKIETGVLYSVRANELP